MANSNTKKKQVSNWEIRNNYDIGIVSFFLWDEGFEMHHFSINLQFKILMYYARKDLSIY